LSTTPTRPDSKEALDEETERVLAEREATFEKDKETAEPWSNVKADILRQPKTPQPR
jgi:hypothetical protein